MKHQNKEITFSFIVLFTKCIPNGYIMTLKCPAPSKFSTSRAMGRAYGSSLPTGIRPICHRHCQSWRPSWEHIRAVIFSQVQLNWLKLAN